MCESLAGCSLYRELSILQLLLLRPEVGDLLLHPTSTMHHHTSVSHPTSAHLSPLLPAVGLVALGELGDEVVCIGLPGCRLDLGITRRLNAVLGLHAVDDVAPGAGRGGGIRFR